MATVRLPNGDWHPEEIKAAVRIAGWTLYALARANNLPEHSCRHAIRSPNYDGELAIAKALGVSPRHLWPSRWAADGKRIPQVRQRRKSNPRHDPRHCQKQEAA
jgi:lambda repressor-like predicted transcriptional regulator